MSPISLDQLVAAKRGGPLPKRSVLVTFDDGERSVLEVGAPLLAERNIPAIAFVVASLVGTSEPHWWNAVIELVSAGGNAGPELPTSGHSLVRALKQVSNRKRLEALERLRDTAHRRPAPGRQLDATDLAELERLGVAVENHSLTHPCLDQCSDDEVATEIEDAHAILSRLLKRSPRAFAYPNGNDDPRVHRHLEGLGYEAAFLFDHKLERRKPPSWMRLSRVRVEPYQSLGRFRMVTSGLHPAIHSLRQRVESIVAMPP
jgi:peptidoglycan/xylan/chitin deacetylase (PgdA/CDA1 family)